MKNKLLFILSVACVAVVIVSSCNKIQMNNKKTTTRLVLDNNPDYKGFENDDLITLGRVLFYDKSLSLNQSISCGSCHKQEFGFADNTELSNGFENVKTNRNSPGLANMALKSNFFWDSRTKGLINLTLQPVANHIEMGFYNINDLPAVLSKQSYYPQLFSNAFGTNLINNENISYALASFVASISSAETDFDKHIESEVFSNVTSPLTSLQKQGLELFRGTYNCTSCHQTALFNKQGTPNEGNGYNSSGEFGTDPSLSSFVDTTFITNEALQAKFKALPNPDNRLALSMAESATNIAPVSLSQANIGLDANPVDAGFAGVTNNNKDMGKMKIPDLRNVMHTGPYMHDGRFKTIDEVLNHYSHGIANNSSLDGRLQDAYGNAAKLNISEIDKLALKAFLTTLTDNSILHNPDFADPFVYE